MIIKDYVLFKSTTIYDIGVNLMLSNWY